MTTTIPATIITTDRGYLFSAVVCTDGTEKEATIMSLGGSEESLGEYEGATIRRIQVQADVGSILSTAKIYSPKGGIVASWVGNERTTEFIWNLNVSHLGIRIVKGMKLKFNTAD